MSVKKFGLTVMAAMFSIATIMASPALAQHGCGTYYARSCADSN